MKLPAYQTGAVKKAVMAFGAIGTTGAFIKYKSHSQGQLKDQTGFGEADSRNGFQHYLQVFSCSRFFLFRQVLLVTVLLLLQKYLLPSQQAVIAALQEALDVTTGSAEEAGKSLLHMLSSLSKAWAGRYVSNAGAGKHLSMPAAVAEFLSAMAEEPERGR